jgi:hypothetical protein
MSKKKGRDTISDAVKMEIFARIEAKDEIRDMVGDYGIPYPKLLQLKKEYQDKKREGTLLDAATIDNMIIDRISNEVSKEATIQYPECEDTIADAAGEFKKGVDGLKLLDTNLQNTAIKLVTRINSLTYGNLEPSEIQKLSAALTNIQNAFFNKPTTNINLNTQINNSSSERVSRFKGLMKN